MKARYRGDRAPWQSDSYIDAQYDGEPASEPRAASPEFAALCRRLVAEAKGQRAGETGTPVRWSP